MAVVGILMTAGVIFMMSSEHQVALELLRGASPPSPRREPQTPCTELCDYSHHRRGRAEREYRAIRTVQLGLIGPYQMTSLNKAPKDCVTSRTHTKWLIIFKI